MALLLGFLLFLNFGINSSYSSQVESSIKPVILTNKYTEYPIGLNLEILEDKSQKLTINEITSPEFSSQFISNHKETPNLGLTTSNIWVRFSVKNEADAEKKWLLVLNDARMTDIQVYLPSQFKSGFIVKETGKYFPFKTREIPHRNFIFNCYNFVKLMGGEITVNSVVGKGTIFSFFISAIEVNNREIQSQPVLKRVIALEPNQPYYKILIVDDKIPNRRLLFKLLQPLGFDVKEASNGQEAIDIWQQWYPDLIFMDLRMPVMDGYQATKQIKATPQGQATPIIAVSSSVLEEQQVLVRSAGCDAFIRKPFNDMEIFETLHQHLGVRYIYESSECVQLPISEKLLTSKDLNPLGEEWLNQMYLAILKGDIMLASDLIAKIPIDHQVLADQFTQLLDQYAFEQILKLTGINNE